MSSAVQIDLPKHLKTSFVLDDTAIIVSLLGHRGGLCSVLKHKGYYLSIFNLLAFQILLSSGQGHSIRHVSG